MSIGCHFLPSEQVPTVDQVQQVSARALSRDAADQTVLSRSIVMAGEECERIGCVAHDGQDSLDGDMGEDVVRQQQVLGSPYFLLGSIDAITAQVEGLRAHCGISYLSVFPGDVEAFAPVVARHAGR
jgi:hypothetical protein